MITCSLEINNLLYPLEQCSFEISGTIMQHFIVACHSLPPQFEEEMYVTPIYLIQQLEQIQIRYLLEIIAFTHTIAYYKFMGHIINVKTICLNCDALRKEYTQTGAIKILDTELVL